MKNLKEILFEKQNTVYTLFFGKNEPIEAFGVKGTRFVTEFVDVIDCGKTIFNSRNMDEFAAPIFKEHYGRRADIGRRRSRNAEIRRRRRDRKSVV